MKIHNLEQGSVDWMLLRAGKLTASEMSALVTPLAKVKTGDACKTLLFQKLAEKWQGAPLPSLNIWEFEQGHVLEQQARPAFTLETGLPVESVGFIEADSGLYGCSPDGLGDGFGLEIKCPHIETHIRYLLDGIVPPDYVAQVQFSLYVTGFKKWYFCSFRRHFPLLVVPVEPDPDYQAAIKEALDGFFERFNEAYAKLVRLNGGPPQRSVAPARAPVEEPVDIFH